MKTYTYEEIRATQGETMNVAEMIVEAYEEIEGKGSFAELSEQEKRDVVMYFAGRIKEAVEFFDANH